MKTSSCYSELLVAINSKPKGYKIYSRRNSQVVYLVTRPPYRRFPPKIRRSPTLIFTILQKKLHWPFCHHIGHNPQQKYLPKTFSGHRLRRGSSAVATCYTAYTSGLVAPVAIIEVLTMVRVFSQFREQVITPKERTTIGYLFFLLLKLGIAQMNKVPGKIEI